MNMQKKLLSLLAGVLLVVSAAADVVYEPLIVKTGFNRDVIAEVYPFDSTKAVSPLYAKHTAKYGITSCFATESVIDTVNKVYNKNNPSDKFTDNDLLIAKSCGWPDDYHTTIRCIEDAKDYYSDPDVIFQLAPYDDPNALCLRPNTDSDESDGYGNQRKGTLRFKKIGCYDKVFFLVVSLRKGGVTTRRVITTIYYSDTTSHSTEFTFEDGLGGKEHQKVHKTNIYESRFKKNTSKDSGKAYASVFDVEVPQSKLIDSIVFENPIPNSAVIILAVTGRTANIAAPEEEDIKTSDIQETSFEACWDYIANAASYRLDVAEDIDFQHLVKGYNNLNVGNSTCQEVAGLLAENDYYWRVRSVNADGGQSASSAPRRVKTAGGDPARTAETDNAIESDLSQFLGSTMSIIVDRTLYKDGYFNTLCLPFSLTAEQIASSPLAGGRLYTFDRADVLGEAQLDVHVNPATTIEAGVPYLIEWNNTGEVLHNLTFTNVTISAAHGNSVGEEGEVQFIGILGQHTLPYENVNNLFVGAENTLYWPINDGTSMKGFRAYFSIPALGPQAVRRGTPARIVMGQNTATDLENVLPSATGVRKIIRDGQVLIIRENGIYNAQGQMVK